MNLLPFLPPSQTKNSIAAAERKARLEAEAKLARVTLKAAQDMDNNVRVGASCLCRSDGWFGMRVSRKTG